MVSTAPAGTFKLAEVDLSDTVPPQVVEAFGDELTQRSDRRAARVRAEKAQARREAAKDRATLAATMGPSAAELLARLAAHARKIITFKTVYKIMFDYMVAPTSVNMIHCLISNRLGTQFARQDTIHWVQKSDSQRLIPGTHSFETSNRPHIESIVSFAYELTVHRCSTASILHGDCDIAEDVQFTIRTSPSYIICIATCIECYVHMAMQSTCPDRRPAQLVYVSKLLISTFAYCLFDRAKTL